MEIVGMTEAEQIEARQFRVSEIGTEPNCPFCGTPRVERTSYIRCNPCGVNWLNEEMHLSNYLSMDPRVVRREAARTASGTKPTADTSKGDAELC